MPEGGPGSDHAGSGVPGGRGPAAARGPLATGSISGVTLAAAQPGGNAAGLALPGPEQPVAAAGTGRGAGRRADSVAHGIRVRRGTPAEFAAGVELQILRCERSLPQTYYQKDF